LANTGAVLLALWIAFARDLDRPYWAMFSVFIVAQPISGAVRSKAVYRFFGTIVGASVAVFLVPPLVHAPVLLSLAISTWVGICLYTSLLDRTPRSYAFLLAGYSAAIIGFSVVDTPQSVFDTAVSRVEEICLGIICGSVAHSVFFPKNIVAELHEKIAATIKGCAGWIAKALARPRRPEDLVTEQRLPQVVTSLHLLYTHVAFETSDVPRAGRVMRTLQDRLAVLLPRLSTIQAATTTLRTNGMLRPQVVAILESTSAWAAAFATAGEEAGETGSLEARSDQALDDAATSARNASTSVGDRRQTLQTQLAALASERQQRTVDWQGLLEQTVITNIEELVTALEDCRTLAQALEHPETRLSPRLEREAATPGQRFLHRDRGLALLSAGAAMLATLTACVLWIEGTWPEGTVAAQFAAIGCSLFATLDKPSKLISAAVIGVLVALPFGAVYEFAIIPRIDGFASLALVLSPALLLFSLMQTFEKREGAALVLAIAFSGSLALQSTYRADFASFVNSNTAEIAGLLIAAVTNLVFRTIDPAWNALRISRAGWRAVNRLARDSSVDIRRWTLQMFDRLGLVTSRLKNADPATVESRHIDGLRDMRVGINIAAIREAATAPYPPELDGVLSLIATTYAARANLTEEPSPTDLEHAIDASIGALAAQGITVHAPSTQNLTADAQAEEPFAAHAQTAQTSRVPAASSLPPHHLTSLAALTSLRLDMAPNGAPYTRTVPAT